MLAAEMKELSLNKDYLNTQEAAVYMGVSVSGFRKVVKKYDIPSGKVEGAKKVFRRADLQELTETYFTAPKIVL